jgi:hypothetical protein
MTVPPESTPRRVAFVIVATIFALSCLSSWGQVVMGALGRGGEPRPLLLLHLLAGGAAYAASVGTMRRRPWAWVAALTWGIVISALILLVGPLVGLDAEERRGLWFGASSTAMIGGGLALYLRSVIRPRETAPAPRT